MQIAEDIDTTKAYVNRIIKRTDGVVNKTFNVFAETIIIREDLDACLDEYGLI